MTDHDALSEKQIRAYRDDGFLVIDDLLSEAEVERLREACEDPRVTDKRNMEAYRKQTLHQLGITSLHEAFRELAMHPAIVGKIKALLGPDIQLQHSKLATKPPSQGVGPFPWHQDYAFYPHTNTDLLSVMVMLDDATPENGCMQMVKGSHKLGVLDHAVDGRFTGECREAHHWSQPGAVVDITPRAGGISVHHALTLHGSPANLSGRPRRGIVFSYRADDAYQLADTVFDDTGLLICGTRRGVVRCDAGIVNLPMRGGEAPYGSAFRQWGGSVQANPSAS